MLRQASSATDKRQCRVPIDHHGKGNELDIETKFHADEPHITPSTTCLTHTYPGGHPAEIRMHLHRVLEVLGLLVEEVEGGVDVAAWLDFG